MAHPSQLDFVLSVKDQFPQFFRGGRVLEVGSRNVNGSTRDLFVDCEYVGVDCVDGPGVDVVCLGHEYDAEPESFDVVHSCEMFEHDPVAGYTIRHMLRLLKRGGLFFMTCAGEGRQEHGTRRTSPDGESIYGPDADFYRNVSVLDLLQWIGPPSLVCQNMSVIHIEHFAEAGDLYAFAVKAKRQ